MSSLRNRSNQGSQPSLFQKVEVERHQAQNVVTNPSRGQFKLNQYSTAEDALAMFNGIKADLADQINALTLLKKNVIKSEQVETSAKSRLRITIESLLIDLNEEIFALSEELAKSYTGEQARTLVSKAREFDHRKKQLIKKVTKTIEEDQVARIVNREFKIQARSRSRSKSQSQSRSRSRSRSLDGKRTRALRDRRPQSTTFMGPASQHSPPEREKTTTTRQLLEKYTSNQQEVPSYVNTETKPLINVGITGGKIGNDNDRYFAMSYENTISSGQPDNNVVPLMPSVIHQRLEAGDTYRKRSVSARGSRSRSPSGEVFKPQKQTYASSKQLSKVRSDRACSNDRKSSKSVQSRKVNGIARVGSARPASNSSFKKINTIPKRPASRQGQKKPPTPALTSYLDNNVAKEDNLSSQSLAKFMNDFNRMKHKMNMLINTQKEQEEKITTLQGMCDRLTAENIKVNAEMRILRDEHTEVLHQMFNFDKKNHDLLKENNALRSVHEGINQDLSTILVDRSKIPIQMQTRDGDISDKDQVTILNGMGSPMIKKQEFALGSLSPTSNNATGAGHVINDANERDSQERQVNIFHRRSSHGSQESKERISIQQPMHSRIPRHNNGTRQGSHQSFPKPEAVNLGNMIRRASSSAHSRGSKDFGNAAIPVPHSQSHHHDQENNMQIINHQSSAAANSHQVLVSGGSIRDRRNTPTQQSSHRSGSNAPYNSSVAGLHNYALPTDSRDGDLNSMMGTGIQGTATLGAMTHESASFQSNQHHQQNAQNNSSFAATDQLNGTTPLSDWVIERLKKNQPRQVQSNRQYSGPIPQGSGPLNLNQQFY